MATMANFRQLPDLELTEAYLHDHLPLESACKHGTLSNGMRYASGKGDRWDLITDLTLTVTCHRFINWQLLFRGSFAPYTLLSSFCCNPSCRLT